MANVNLTGKTGQGARADATSAPAFFTALALMAIAVLIASFAWAPQTAFAEKIVVNAPTKVSDDITRIHVDKVDSRTHEFVPGAKMAIIEKETGKVVEEWTTGKETYRAEKTLDVNTVYILREVEAPEDYSKIDDIEFVIDPDEGQGVRLLNSPEGVEKSEEYKVTLFEAHDANVVTATETRTRTSTTVAPRTGDETPMGLVAGLVVVGIVGIAALQFARMRFRDE